MLRQRLINLMGSVMAQLPASQVACPAAAAAGTEITISAHRVMAAHSAWDLHQQPFASIFRLQQQQHQLHTSVCAAASQSPQHFVQIGRLSPAPGASKLVSQQTQKQSRVCSGTQFQQLSGACSTLVHAPLASSRSALAAAMHDLQHCVLGGVAGQEVGPRQWG